MGLALCLSCVSLTASAVDSSVYLPVGYGTSYTTTAIDVKFVNKSQNLGVIGSERLTAWKAPARLTTTDSSQRIYTQPLATWSGNVPAGTDEFFLTNADGVVIGFYSDGWNGVKGTLKGTVSCWLGYGSSHSSYSHRLYPKNVDLFLKYEGDEGFTYVRTLSCANGVVTINEPIESPVSKLYLSFSWGAKTVNYPNNFPSPTVAWGFTYIDDLTWETSSVTSGAQIVDEQRTTNNLITSIISAVNNIFQSITELPQKIASALQGLFIPDEEQMNILRGKWQVFLTTKMGFIYQMFQWVDTFFNGIIDNLTGEDTGAFEIPAFPAFEAGGETVQLWSEPLTVDFSDNAFVQTLQPIACPFILGVTAYHLWFAMSDLMECFFAGKSYRDYHEGRREE